MSTGKQRRARGALITAGLTATALALTACAGGAAPTQGGGSPTQGGDPTQGGEVSGTVSFRSWSPVAQTTEQMVASFQNENPGTTIDATIFNRPQYVVELQTRAGSNTLPDIVGLQAGAQTQQYREHLMPLNKCAEDTWGADWKSKFYPIALSDALLGNPEGDENFYALPMLVQTLNLWANTQMFERTGATIPATWSDLESTVELMKSKGENTPFLLPAKGANNRVQQFMQIVNNIAPGLVYKAESGDAKWTDPQIVEAIDYYGKLVTEIAQPGALSLDAYPTAANMFEAGEAGMIPLGAWWIQQSDPTKDQSTIPELSRGMSGYAPFLFPTIPGGAATPEIVGGSDVLLGISKNSQNPELACKVITNWIAGSGAQVLINTMNDLPAVIGLTPAEFTGANQEEIWNTLVDDWLPQVKYTRYLQSPQVDSAVANELAAVGAGETAPEQAAVAIQQVQDQVLAG